MVAVFLYIGAKEIPDQVGDDKRGRRSPVIDEDDVRDVDKYIIEVKQNPLQFAEEDCEKIAGNVKEGVRGMGMP